MCETCGDNNHGRRLVLKVPAEVMELHPEKRAKIVTELAKSLGLKSEMRTTAESVARNFVTDFNEQMERPKSIWQPHEDENVAELEDKIYADLAIPLWNTMLDLFDVLGLEYPTYQNLQKSLDDPDEIKAVGYLLNTLIKSDDLIKADDDDDDDDDFMTMEEVNKRYGNPRDPKEGRSRKRPSAPYKADGGSFTEREMQTIEKVLARYSIGTKKIAEYIATAGTYLGRLISAFEGENEKLRRVLVNQLPVTLEARKQLDEYALTQKESEKFGLPLLPLQKQEENAIRWAQQFGAEKIGDIDEKTKKRIRALIVQARRARMEPKQLEQLLFDEFGALNRDMRRIALTELAEAMNNGYLMELPHLQPVTILGADNACDFCKSMQGGHYIFVDPDKVDNLDWDTMVWIGKTNYGRRKADWKPCCPAHPHCRDRYVKFNPKFQKVDKQQRKIVLKNRDEIIGDALQAKLEGES